ncbi:MAG TPA: hypothetical protein VIM96_01430 [Pseudomonadales bacterium]
MAWHYSISDPILKTGIEVEDSLRWQHSTVHPSEQPLRTPDAGHVISLDRWRCEHAKKAPLPLRLAPELDTFQILYRNSRHHNKLYALDIIGWALMSDGSVDALVPWMNRLHFARRIDDPLCGHWEGYYLPGAELILEEPPSFKVQELESAAAYFGLTETDGHICPQALPDTSGTWALLYDADRHKLKLEPVARWLLDEHGILLGELYADDNQPDAILALPGNPEFRYFLHESVVQQLMDGGDEAFNALAESLQH